MNFNMTNGSKEQKPVIYGKASELVDFIIDHMQIVVECFVKVISASGQNLLKFLR